MFSNIKQCLKHAHMFHPFFSCTSFAYPPRQGPFISSDGASCCSLNAVQSKTPIKGTTVLDHIIGPSGRQTMMLTKRKYTFASQPKQFGKLITTSKTWLKHVNILLQCTQTNTTFFFMSVVLLDGTARRVTLATSKDFFQRIDNPEKQEKNGKN